MDLFEYNKIAGAALATLLVILGVRTFADLLYAPDAAHETAYIVEGLPVAGDSGAADAIADAPSIAQMLAAASADSGVKVARKCVACHTFEKGGKNAVGPNLWGIVNRPVGTVPGFDYSAALAAKGGTWTLEELFRFLAAPRAALPGTNMAFAGLKKPKQQADIIIYLNGLADSPAPLPNPNSSRAQQESLELGEPPDSQ